MIQLQLGYVDNAGLIVELDVAAVFNIHETNYWGEKRGL